MRTSHRLIAAAASLMVGLGLTVASHAADPESAQPEGQVAAPSTSAALDALCQRLRHQAGKAEADQIVLAIQSSPELSQQLEALMASGKLADIVVLRSGSTVAGTQFRAAVVGNQIVLTKALLSDLQKDHPHQNLLSGADILVPDNTVFVLGHLAAHALLDADSKTKADAEFNESLKNMNTPGWDATAAIVKAMNAGLTVEAKAFLQGWNDVIDAATVAHPNLSPDQIEQLLLNFRYRSYFIQGMQHKPDALVMKPNGRFEASDSNVATFIVQLRDSAMADIQ